MPTYEYSCTKCGEHLEAVQSFSDDPLKRCPACGGKLKKVFGNVGIVFKGSGFYKTDSRNSTKAAATSTTSEKTGSDKSGSDKSGSDKSSSGSDSASTSTSKSDSGTPSKDSGSTKSSSGTPSKAAAS
jgi:putative FmdB family regulatory protein